jgi:hypothetical protein
MAPGQRRAGRARGQMRVSSWEGGDNGICGPEPRNATQALGIAAETPGRTGSTCATKASADEARTAAAARPTAKRTMSTSIKLVLIMRVFPKKSRGLVYRQSEIAS